MQGSDNDNIPSVPAVPSLRNAFYPGFLKQIGERDEPVTAAEADVAGPWRVEKIEGAGWALYRAGEGPPLITEKGADKLDLPDCRPHVISRREAARPSAERAKIRPRAPPRMPQSPDDKLAFVEGVVEVGHQPLEVEAANPGDRRRWVERTDAGEDRQHLDGLVQIVVQDLRSS